MSSKDSSLYGMPRPTKKASSKEISSSTTLSFTSQLSSLISSGNTEGPRNSSGRSRPKKEDIFSSHNRNTKKRALKDLEPDASSFEQKHTTNGESLDSAMWHRSKRKMEEKARLYAAMKRGDVEDEDGKHMVDFDRKWAETTEKDGDGDSGSDDNDLSEGEAEQVEWVDEFGRTRTGTAAERDREQRMLQLGREMETRARPAVPANIIYGDTVQAAAFNPDESIETKMAELAAKRDRSLTPPPDTHFDGSKEIRSKGVGFMQFSADDEERKKQMAGLDADRKETEQRRAERDKRLQDRKAEVEKRRQEIQSRRGKRKADEFLDGLGEELSRKDREKS